MSSEGSEKVRVRSERGARSTVSGEPACGDGGDPRAGTEPAHERCACGATRGARRAGPLAAPPCRVGGLRAPCPPGEGSAGVVRNAEWGWSRGEARGMVAGSPSSSAWPGTGRPGASNAPGWLLRPRPAAGAGESGLRELARPARGRSGHRDLPGSLAKAAGGDRDRRLYSLVRSCKAPGPGPGRCDFW